MVTVPEQQEHEDIVQNIDFKMVTFSLAGKDYSIDIMKVKEISKASNFTYVPNSPPYVRGVYNLRGDIISIIDLRKLFNIPSDQKQKGTTENILILRLKENVIGIVVDSIDKVVGVSSDTIQPPHPIFGEINIKYIQGVVESDDKLYIILDVDAIFEKQVEEITRYDSIPETVNELQTAEAVDEKQEAEKLTIRFIQESLAGLRHFHVSKINRTWTENRFEEWQNDRKQQDKEVQLMNPGDADEFLSTFYSRCTATFWSDEYIELVSQIIAKREDHSIRVWNPGCGRGYESYSLAVLLRTAYPEARIKIWAQDNDLLSISTGPLLSVQQSEQSKYFEPYLVEGKNGYAFSDEIKDLILFEYHDILNINSAEDLDFIVVRDTLSFIESSEQDRLLAEFYQKLKPTGILILGDNEVAPTNAGWKQIDIESIRAYKK